MTAEIFLGLIVVGVVVFTITSLIRWATEYFFTSQSSSKRRIGSKRGLLWSEEALLDDALAAYDAADLTSGDRR